MIFSEHASPAFNQRMQESLSRLAADCHSALGTNLQALILGGGYGRGEGGVVRRDGAEHPYNDLDLTIIVQRESRDLGRPLRAISTLYEKEIGIDVDFSRPLTMRDVRNWPHTLMWQDLLEGHHVLCGPEDILSRHAPAALRKPLPAIEATHLLLNRGAGLLWARRVARGLEPPPDGDFLRRNFQKAALALGDAVLIAHQRHHVRCTEREARLGELLRTEAGPAKLDIESAYREAVAFKLRPDAVGEECCDDAQLAEMARLWGRVLLYVESRRTGRPFQSLNEYVRYGKVREPEQNRLGKWPRNLFQNFRLRRLSLRYPREFLYRELPGLLVHSHPQTGDWADKGQAFLEVWERYN